MSETYVKSSQYEINKIHKKFKQYNATMRDVWEEYFFLSSLLENSIRTEFEMLNLHHSNIQSVEKTKIDFDGIRQRMILKTNVQTHFINAIMCFEDYITLLTEKVYSDFPERMDIQKSESLYNIILSSTTKEEIIKTIAEDKARCLLYRNLGVALKNDSFKFDLNGAFTKLYPDCLDNLDEIIRRRNVIVHKAGKMDKKYIEEKCSEIEKEFSNDITEKRKEINNRNKVVNTSKDQNEVTKNKEIISGLENEIKELLEEINTKCEEFKSKNLNKSIVISTEYLRGTIGLLIGIAAVITSCVISNIYGETVGGTLKKSLKVFKNQYDIGWYNKLLNS